ncbi:hypothetical protein BR93DRAFT_954610 [Coniochaeta sp. PMI_546]|nr:hypothetical protein BR93DRAFT_954610 [Coniochaeta sp. PMI_546]
MAALDQRDNSQTPLPPPNRRARGPLTPRYVPPIELSDPAPISSDSPPYDSIMSYSIVGDSCYGAQPFPDEDESNSEPCPGWVEETEQYGYVDRPRRVSPHRLPHHLTHESLSTLPALMKEEMSFGTPEASAVCQSHMQTHPDTTGHDGPNQTHAYGFSSRLEPSNMNGSRGRQPRLRGLIYSERDLADEDSDSSGDDSGMSTYASSLEEGHPLLQFKEGIIRDIMQEFRTT